MAEPTEPVPSVAPVLEFGEVELNRDTRRVLVGGEVEHVEPQVFDVLLYLVDNRDRVVPKTELLDEVWGSRFVSESALTSRIKTARAVVGDDGRSQHTIRTAHGTGYQFVAEVNEHDSGPVAAPRRAYARYSPPGNRFHGRHEDLQALDDLLDQRRLITVIGPGGTGKTRLTAELVSRRDQPSVFVDLAALRDGAAIGQALLAALGIESGSSSDEIGAACDFLRSESVCVLMDNCEHIATEAAEVAGRLLTETQSTTVLATSRVPLGLKDEYLYRLPPLPTISHEGAITVEVAMINPSVALFVDRAEQVRHGFALDPRSAQQAVAVCRALDGLPLAIELAAGRIGSFGLEDLLHRLDQRLDLLGDDRHDVTDRHRSLRATLNWSFELLDPPCQELLMHLSVFPAGLTLKGVEWLTGRLELDGDAFSMVDRLVRMSLLERVEHPSGSRYVQLATMRTFGVDRLESDGRLTSARDLGVEWVKALLADLGQSFLSARETQWDDAIRRELPNIRHGRLHLLDQDRHVELIEISVGLHDWGTLRDVSELWLWCDELMALADQDADHPGDQGQTLSDVDRCRVKGLAGQAAWRRGRVAEAESLAEAVLGGCGDTWSKATGYTALGVSYLFQGRFQEAVEAWGQRFEIDGSTFELSNASVAAAYAGDIDRARQMAAQAHQIAADLEAPTGLAWATYCCGEVEACAGSTAALRLLETAVERARRIGSSFTYGVASVTLCSLMMAEGRTSEVAERYGDLITHWLRSGTWTQLWTTLRNAVTLLIDSHPEVVLLTIDKAASDPMAPGMGDETAAELAELRHQAAEAVGPDRVAELQTEALTIDRVELASRVRACLSSS